LKKMIVAAGATMAVLAVGFSTGAGADGESKIDFTPIAGSAYGQTEDHAQPWVLPAGYSQTVVSDETDLDIYTSLCATGLNPGSDWPDMLVSNESGKRDGRYLYRTHEVRPFLYDPACAAAGLTQAAKDAFMADGGGAVSVIDSKTGKTTVLAQRADWDALDGLVWTPWGSLLFAEEALATEIPDPTYPNAQAGLLYELTLAKGNPTKARAVATRPLLGSLSHEGIELDKDGNVYVIDEDRRGSIYRFVPDTYGDLSSGQLQVLKVDAGKTGSASWIDLDMTQVQISARVAAAAVGGTQFCRPEDLERIKNTMYAALTCEDVTNAANINGPGAVLAITLGNNPKVSYFASSGLNAPVENRAAGVTGFRAVDNLANGPDGTLWIVEDNAFSDIWVATPDKNGDGAADSVSLFASLKDAGAEGTGIYFGEDDDTLYVNIQHSTSGNDSTIAIERDDD
jgi:uncharacterized protein